MLADVHRLLNPDQSLIFLTLANLLYVVCYGVRDVLWLRIFSVTAMLVIMPYYIWGTEQTQFSCICWNLLFFSINLFWIVVIIRQRRPPKMTVQQKRLYARVFERSCSPQEMLKLLSIAKSEASKRGDEIVARGSNPNGLILIEEGYANVMSGKEEFAKLGRGDFVGEVSYLTGQPAIADVVADSSMKLFRWTTEDLNKLFLGRPELKAAINEIIARDLTRKLNAETCQVPELSITMMVTDSQYDAASQSLRRE